MKYNEVYIKLSPVEPYRDLLTYSLGEEGPYDSFVDTPDGIKAYVPTSEFQSEYLDSCIKELKNIDTALQCSYSVVEMPDKDYNEEWERQHQAVLVENFCWVRAPFHPRRDDVKYDIVIEPKMSFGTAHHATTYLMLSLLETENVENKCVLDMGSGTGVLAILAAKKGAAYVEAIDVDEWAFRNAKENFERNNVNVTAMLGDASLLKEDKHFDVVLANINRNILLRDMGAYVGVLNLGGTLLVSGFYEHDVDALRKCASELGLNFGEYKCRNEWAAIRFVKS